MELVLVKYRFDVIRTGRRANGNQFGGHYFFDGSIRIHNTCGLGETDKEPCLKFLSVPLDSHSSQIKITQPVYGLH